MIDNDVVPGEVPDDSPWRPGADARFDHPPIRPFDGRVTGGDTDEGAPVRDRSDAPPPAPKFNTSRRRGLAGVLVLVLAVVGVVVVRRGVEEPSGGVQAIAPSPIDAATGGRSAVTDLGGNVTLGSGDSPLLTAAHCPAQRLPSVVDPLWDVELPDARQVITPATVTEESVVAVVGFDELTANGLPSVSVVTLNTDDGQERWRAGLEPATGRHEIVGIADGSVIVRSAAGLDMAYRRLFAFDEASGAVLWDRGFRGDWSATMNERTGLVYVGVRRPAVSATDVSEVSVHDPRTGDRLHVAAGAPVGLDPDGRLVTRLGDEVLATSVEDRDLLGVVEPSDAAFAVAGSQVVVADGAVTDLTVFAGDAGARRVPLVGSTGIDSPGFVVSLDPLGESSLIVNGDGAVHGAQVGEDTVEIRWRVMGVTLESEATDRGRSLVIATDGGERQRVIDSSTGRTIVHLEPRPGFFGTLALVANGVVVQDTVDGEPVRSALDLDGRELWSLPGSGRLSVGRGVVVDVDDSDSVLRLSAWGDPVDARSDVVGCRSVMTEWIQR